MGDWSISRTVEDRREQSPWTTMFEFNRRHSGPLLHDEDLDLTEDDIVDSDSDSDST